MSDREFMSRSKKKGVDGVARKISALVETKRQRWSRDVIIINVSLWEM